MTAEITPCPRCGTTPIPSRVGSYWRVSCPNHRAPLIFLMQGHVMKTRRDAIAEWNLLALLPTSGKGATDV